MYRDLFAEVNDPYDNPSAETSVYPSGAVSSIDPRKRRARISQTEEFIGPLTAVLQNYRQTKTHKNRTGNFTNTKK